MDARVKPGHDPEASFRDGPKDQTRNLEIPGSCFARPGMTTTLCHRPRRRAIQYSREVSDWAEKPRRTGYRMRGVWRLSV